MSWGKNWTRRWNTAITKIAIMHVGNSAVGESFFSRPRRSAQAHADDFSWRMFQLIFSCDYNHVFRNRDGADRTSILSEPIWSMLQIILQITGPISKKNIGSCIRFFSRPRRSAQDDAGEVLG